MEKLKNKEQLTDFKKDNNLSFLNRLVVPGTAILLILFGLSFLGNKIKKPANINSANNTNISLKDIESNPNLAAQNQAKAQAEAPYYGFQDQVVNRKKVVINLRDNGIQDGDIINLFINDQLIVQNHFLLIKGTSVSVPVQPGVNLVKIIAVRDGGQNGGVSLAADVAGQPNSTSSLFPENATAIFKIIRQ